MLVEAGLELVPPQIANHPAVTSNALRRGKRAIETLLDMSLHKSAMKKLPYWYKRGRPDIVHRFLILAQDSLINIEGKLRTHIHTIGDIYIEVKPEMRPPRDYRRFIGLMEQLLLNGSVPKERPLLIARPMSLNNIKDLLKPDCVVLLKEGGRETPESLVKLAKKCENLLVMVGGFQQGDFRRETLELATEIISIYKRPLSTSTVVSRILCMLEMAILKMPINI